MPMAVVGTGLKDASAAAVKASGKLRVHIQGNVHAGEVEGKESAQVLLREFALGQHKDWLQSMVFLVTPDLQRRRQREVRAHQPPAAERADQRHGDAGQRAEPEHQPRLHEARHAGSEGVRQAVGGLRPAGRLRSPHLRRIGPRLPPDLLAAAQSRHQPRDHEDDDGRVVSVRDEEHEGEARVGHVLLRQRVDAGRRARPAAVAHRRSRHRAGRRAAGAARSRLRRPPDRASGARSSTCRASTTTTSACAIASRC